MLRTIKQTLTSLLVTGLVSSATFQVALGAPATPLDVPSPPAQAKEPEQQTVGVGDSSVSTQTGALQYSYPVAVPPGRGMTPSVSLNYSSQAANYGGLAVGWTLSAGAFIEVDTSDGRDYLLNGSWSDPPLAYRSSLAGGARLIPVNDSATPLYAPSYRALGDTSYARYRRTPGIFSANGWEVMLDGVTYEFGNHAHIDGAASTTRWPLTRQVDTFGNSIDYYWHGNGSLDIKSIVYTSNPEAGAPHARIDFEYVSNAIPASGPCSELVTPIGSRLDTSHGFYYAPGSRKLRAIKTYAADGGSGSLREARTVELRYMDGTLGAPLDSEVCTEKHAPQRLLWQIVDSGRSPDGTVTALPPITFGYGSLERPLDHMRWMDRPALAPDEPENALVWGKRFSSPWRWPTVEAMLLDVDADGFQDRLVMHDRQTCTASLQRGGPNGFSASAQLIQLPWMNGAAPGNPNGQYDDCSLAGRLSFFRNVATPPAGKNQIGSYLAYRFLSIAGNDDLPDIVAALHYDQAFLSAHEGQLGAMGLAPASCDPSIGAPTCPLVQDACLDQMMYCPEEQHPEEPASPCTFDPSEPPWCLSAAEQVPCGALLAGAPETDEPEPSDDTGGAGDADTEEEEDCWDNGNCEVINCWEGPLGAAGCSPMTEPPPTGGGTIVMTTTTPENAQQARQRSFHAADCGYVWYVYKNLGGGQFATVPQVVHSPVPLESNDGSSTVGTGPTGFTSAKHGIMDLNGDGHLDVFVANHDDMLRPVDPSYPVSWLTPWYVFFGDGNGGFRGDPSTGSAFVWFAPEGATPGSSLQGFGFRLNSNVPLRLSFQQSALIDVNGDGLVDFLRRRRPIGSDLETPLHTEVFLNSGTDFFPGHVVAGRWLSKDENHGRLATTEITLQSIYQFTEKYIGTAYGQSTAGAVDRDGDGLVDFFFPVMDDEGSPGTPATYLPYQTFNGGGGRMMSTPHHLNEWLTTPLPAWQDPMMERVQFDPHRWWVSSRFTDVTGDGRPDVVDMRQDGGTGPYRMHVTTDDGSPMRLMTSIANGRGATIDVTYAPHTDASAVTQHPEAGFSTAQPLWVATSLRSRDQWSNLDATTTYHYIDPVTTIDDLGRHGFRGFREVIANNPTGSISTTTYGYDVDPTGRAIGGAVYANIADHDADRPQSMTKTRWRGFELYPGVFTYHPDAESAWTCSNGQTAATCLDEGSQRSQITTWMTLSNADFQSRVVAATRVADYAVRLSWADGGPIVGDQWDPSDRAVDHEYVLHSDFNEYRLLETATQLVRLPDEQVISRSTTDYDSTYRLPIRQHTWIEDTAATTSAGYDVTTGLRVWTQSAEAYADPSTRAEHGDAPCDATGAPSKPVTCTTYDAHHLYAASVRNAFGHQTYSTYDYATGQPVEVLGPNPGQHSQVVYDGLGRPLETYATGRPGTEWALTLLARTTYEDAPASGPPRVTSETRRTWAGDMTAVVVESDGGGRPIRQITDLSADGLPDAIETYEYYPDSGKLKVFTVPDPSEVTSSGAVVSYSFQYDSLGRPTLALRPAPSVTGVASGVRTSYDGIRTMTQECVVVAGDCRVDPAAGEAPAATVLATKEMTTDAFGRLIEVAEQSGEGEWAITQYGYNARDEMELMVDAEGNVTELHHDGAGNRRTITRAGRTWEYQYDLDGNLVAQIEPVPQGQSTAPYTSTFAYDVIGRLTSHQPAPRDLTSAEQTEFGVFLVRNTYDIAPNGIGAIAHEQTYGYASSGGMGGGIGIGGGFGGPSPPLILWADYTYDLRGNTTEEVRGFDLTASGAPFEDSRSIIRAFDPLGNEIETYYPDTNELGDRSGVARTYDARGLPHEAVWTQCEAPGEDCPLPLKLAEYVRNSAGRGLYAYAGATNNPGARFTYDRLGRVLDHVVVFQAGMTSNALARQTFEYGATDEVAQLKSELAGVPARTGSYDYDQRHQLTLASDDRGFSGHYEYGLAGRLTAVTVEATNAPDAHPRSVDYEYNGADPEAVTRLVQPPGAGGEPFAEYVYDDSGNVVLRTECTVVTAGVCVDTTAFRYDGDVRQRSATNAVGIQELYFYDPASQRVLSIEKNTSNGAYQQARYWFGETELWYDSSGAPSKSWVHVSHGAPVARIENRTEVEFTYHSALGHLLVSVAPDGTPTGGFNYGPFGEILDAIGDPDEHLRRFNGKDADKISGLNYYGYRYYDPLSLTWSQADPKYRFLPDAAWSEPRRANLYVFTGNNPMSLVDPDGLQWGGFRDDYKAAGGDKRPKGCPGTEDACRAVRRLGTAIGVALGAMLVVPAAVAVGGALIGGGRAAAGAAASAAKYTAESVVEGVSLSAKGAAVAGAAYGASKAHGALTAGSSIVPREFSAHIDGNDGVMARIGKDGFVDLYIQAGPNTPRGGEMFNEALRAFGSDVKGVRGNWFGTGDMTDNFDSFKEALNGDWTSEKEAAFETFTGKMSARAGFTEARVITNTDTKVVVEFSKP